MMRRLAAAFLLLSSTATVGTATAQTLFSYGGNPVSKQEFLRVYTKNSLTQKPDYSDKALREYLDLYSLFRMKVKEAQNMQLDTVPSIGRELDNYRRQLAKTYLTDEQTTNRLVREAYDRTKEEVRVSHILVLISPQAQPADTMAKYRLIDSLYRITTTGGDFAALAKQYSEDRGSATAGGDIGYMTGLQTVYPFENTVFATPVGKISKPFRTQFGYHILKVVARRPAQGEVTVAQIMAAAPETQGEKGLEMARKQLDSVRAALRAGMSFADAARKFSDDKFTAEQGGMMDPFTVGRTTPAFEAAAFALKKPGDISTEPIRTEYGLHIIQLIRRTPPKPYDSVSASIKRRVEADSRAQTARDAYFETVKKKHGFKENPAAFDALVAEMTRRISDTGAMAGTFKASDYAGMNSASLFSIGGQSYTGADLASYTETLTRGRLQGPKEPIMRDVYKMYVGKVVNDFQESSLEKENPDFKNLMGEYRDGILLFELMDRNVWSKAGRDTTGLQTFFAGRSGKYTWEPGFRGTVYRFKNEDALKAGMAMLRRDSVKADDVMRSLNESTPDAVTVQRGRYEWSRFSDVPRSAVPARGVGAAQKGTDGSYTVVVTDETFAAAAPKTLEDARGYVVAEYQDYLEKEWNAELRRKYPVKVEEPVFKSMVK